MRINRFKLWALLLLGMCSSPLWAGSELAKTYILVDDLQQANFTPSVGIQDVENIAQAVPVPVISTEQAEKIIENTQNASYASYVQSEPTCVIPEREAHWLKHKSVKQALGETSQTSEPITQTSPRAPEKSKLSTTPDKPKVALAQESKTGTFSGYLGMISAGLNGIADLDGYNYIVGTLSGLNTIERTCHINSSNRTGFWKTLGRAALVCASGYNTVHSFLPFLSFHDGFTVCAKLISALDIIKRPSISVALINKMTNSTNNNDLGEPGQSVRKYASRLETLAKVIAMLPVLTKTAPAVWTLLTNLGKK